MQLIIVNVGLKIGNVNLTFKINEEVCEMFHTDILFPLMSYIFHCF